MSSNLPSTSQPSGATATVYGAIVTLVSALISLLFGVVSALGDGPALQEGQVTGLGVAIAGAIYTLVQARKRAPDGPTSKGVTVSVVLPVLLVLGVLAVSAMSGCLPRQVHADRSIGVDIRRGPPCVIVITADGDVASTVTGPRCDGLPELAAPAPAVTP